MRYTIVPKVFSGFISTEANLRDIVWGLHEAQD